MLRVVKIMRAAALTQSVRMQYSRCRTCVMEMDHHCIFLNNCVGLNNMRHFLLLIVFLMIGCIYVLSSCVVLLLQQQDLVRAQWAR